MNKLKVKVESYTIRGREKEVHAPIISDEYQVEHKNIDGSVLKISVTAAPIEDENWKEKYEKCISVIKRFDAGIIGMYDL